MSRPKGSGKTPVEAFQDRVRGVVASFGGDAGRRRVVIGALALTVPVAALAQPLGLLLWARIKLLTSIPRTAMAVEAETVVADANPVEAFPDLPPAIAERGAPRDPFRISGLHFPNAGQNTAETRFEDKSASRGVEVEDREASHRRDRIASIAARLEVQGLMPGRGIALIGGRVLRAGESFPGDVDGTAFRLVSVEESSVVVESDGFEFDIRLIGGGTESVVIRP